MEKLIVRKARSSDKKAVVAFCSKIWEGWDYLPRVWDQWLEDPYGAFLVAELAGHPVGTGKITVLSPEELWLEGLRVDPQYRGRGIARALNQRAMEIVMQLRPSTVRYSTVFDNWASRHMGEEAGFRLFFQCRRMLAQAQMGELPPGAQGSMGEVDEILAFLEKSANFRRMKGLFAWGWIFKNLDGPFLERVLVEGGALVARRHGRMSGVALFLRQRHGPKAALGFIDGNEQELVTLAGQFRNLAARRGFQDLLAMVPESSTEALLSAGFRLEEPVSVVVYDLSRERLEKAHREKGDMTISGTEG